MFRIVFVRHGESEYNVLKKCAGWLDCNLTANGMAQARAAGRLLADQGYLFDIAFSSELTRAKHTRELILDEMGLAGIHLRQSWRLNERHYGGLDDMTKEEAECRFGQEAVRLCRESFRFRPPAAADRVDACSLVRLPDGSDLDSESMRDATVRCLHYWMTVLVPSARSGRSILVVAHGEILRLLMGYLLHMTEEEIVRTPVLPNATPVIFDFDGDLTVITHNVLCGSAQLSPVLEPA